MSSPEDAFMHGTTTAPDTIDPDAAGFAPDRLARIDRFFDEEVAAKRVPGAVMLIERRGQPALERAWGVRDPADGAPMTLDTIFRIYSMTKPIVSVAAMMLAEEARLQIGQPVADFIPAFADVKLGHLHEGTIKLAEPKRAMTVQDLLRHTSGITYGTVGDLPIQRLYREKGLARGSFTNEEFANRLAALPLAHEPATVWDYSHSTDVLGRVVEVVAGKPLSAVLKEKIFDPLGMHETGFHVPNPADHARIAEPFEGDTPFGPGTRLSEPRHTRPFESGGGGLVSTLADYARFSRMLLNGGALEGVTVLGSRTLAFMASDHIGPGTGIVQVPAAFPGPLLGPGHGFGLGFSVRTEAGGSVAPGSIGEFGWTGIAGTHFWIDPREEMFVVILTQAPTQRQRLRTVLKTLVYAAIVG